MSQVSIHKNRPIGFAGLLTALALLTLTLTAVLPAQAQFAGPQPPPIGSGMNPPPVNPGDTNGVPAVPTGTADNTPGTDFNVGVGHDRTVVRLYKQDTNGRGERMVQTLRGDTLSDQAAGQIAGILGVNFNSGEQSIDVTVTDAQLEQINEAMAAYPQTSNVGGKKKIVGDNPGAGYPKTPAIYAFDDVLPTVRTFSRYLVILGVVCSTIFMSMAAWSMVMGNQYGAARVMGAASGLLMLLAGYTIWKIVQMNTFNANSDTPAQNRQRASTAQVQDAFMQRPNMPATPNVGGGANGRSGVPVQPLYGSN